MNPGTKLRIGMISTHPLSEGGVASYTRNLVQCLTRHVAYVVLFSNGSGNKVLTSSKGIDISKLNIRVCWKRGLFYPFQIFREVARNDVDVIHVQHEFFLFGGSLSAGLFPLLLLLLRFSRKPTMVTLHGVVPLSEVNRQFLSENRLNGLSMMLKLGSILSIKAILRLADAVVVHEKCFADVLRNDYKCSTKIATIPHGINEVKNKLTQAEAKEKLGLPDRKLILYFGYLCEYKGLETLIEGFGRIAQKHKDWVLIIGGGEHPRLRTNPSYKTYVSELRNRAFSLAPHQTIFTGFISEEELPIYFSAVDLVVFPHNVVLSASGSLACALSYLKPVLLSEIAPFQEIIDVKEAFFSKNSPISLGHKMELLINNPDARQKITSHVQKITSQTSWDKVCHKTIELYQHELVKH